MAGKNVQFRSEESVLKAFAFSKATTFSVWHEKEFLFKFVGSTDKEARAVLADYLDMISDSKAIYTLKVYELEGEDKLNEKTPCSGSFNFRLSELQESDFGERGSYGNNGNHELLTRLKAIEEKLQAKAVEDNADDEETGIGGILGHVNELIANPMIGPIVANFLGKILGAGQPAGRPAQLSGVPAGADDNQLLQAAIIKLRANDPDLAKHLYKLAEMSETKPGQFKMLLGMLDNF